MDRPNTLKLAHFASTAWFTLSAGYILVSALRQAGFRWWVIFSLSGYSALIVFMLISLYLFAIFRGVARNQKTAAEHPLTTSTYYLVLYDVSPFLGTLAGCIGMIGVNNINQFISGVALGTLGATFLVWIIVDPAAGMFEMLLPSIREHRRERLAQDKAIREKERSTKQRLLAEVQAEEQLERARWTDVLQPYAEKLSALMMSVNILDENGKHRETEVVDIGLNAWQMGGSNCMRQLHSMAMEICKRKCRDAAIIDYISIWWDGIGSWRNQWLEGELSQS